MVWLPLCVRCAQVHLSATAEDLSKIGYLARPYPVLGLVSVRLRATFFLIHFCMCCYVIPEIILHAHTPQIPLQVRDQASNTLCPSASTAVAPLGTSAPLLYTCSCLCTIYVLCFLFCPEYPCELLHNLLLVYISLLQRSTRFFFTSPSPCAPAHVPYAPLLHLARAYSAC